MLMAYGDIFFRYTYGPKSYFWFACSLFRKIEFEMKLSLHVHTKSSFPSWYLGSSIIDIQFLDG